MRITSPYLLLELRNRALLAKLLLRVKALLKILLELLKTNASRLLDPAVSRLVASMTAAEHTVMVWISNAVGFSFDICQIQRIWIFLHFVAIGSLPLQIKYNCMQRNVSYHRHILYADAKNQK